ncbi:gcr2p [Saccharomyces arboricola H-6]|uniref:Gcr2p n=1 Tax=Saccharomyces arboricola (strain H-6 / AS 2.3317 / CBS 10644) TaxID=1160507 RepID=J8LIZ8_SACAR|nr:gcr2p [Saccharomyces arboricola H-6]
MHHQTKLDVFIIRAYNLLSNESVISGASLQSVTNSPQTATNTPSGVVNGMVSTGITNPTGLMGSDGTPNIDEIITSTGSTALAKTNSDSANATPNGNSSSTSAISHNSNPTNTGNNAGSNTTSNGICTQAQYSQLFAKISKLYNATLSSGSIDDRSTSPKSAIELYQRFQQIIKELELSFEASPYAKYFRRLDGRLWQIKTDSELENDELWRLVSMSIYTVFDPQTGQISTQGRRKGNSLNTSTKGSPSDLQGINNGNTNGNNGNIGNGNNIKNYGNKNANTNRTKKRGTRVAKNAKNNKNNKNANKERNSIADTSTFNGTTIGNPGTNMLFDPSLSQQLQRRLQTLSQDVNSRSLTGYYTQPTSPGSGGFEFGLGHADLNPNTSNNSMGYNTMSNNGSHSWKRRSLGSLDVNTLDDEAVEELLQLTNTNKRQRPLTTTDGALINDGTDSHLNTANTQMKVDLNPSNNMAPVDTEVVIRPLKEAYDAIISEKDQRIVQLERELEVQRQETQWLRKMLIEDMGCVRSMLRDLQR